MQTDAAAIAARWAQNYQSSGDKRRAGAQNPTVNPIQAAIAHASDWQRAVSSADALNRYRTNLGRVTQQDWTTAYVEKGIPNGDNGVRAAQPKVQAFMGAFLPFLQTGVAQVRAMPKGKGAANEARMLAMSRYNARFKRT